MPLAPKTRLGTYEILGPLGAGGMGEVYRANDLRLGREVAVKVLPREVASSPERLARFEREARAVAALSHPNIVVLHSIEEDGGYHFLTMELLEGQTLDTLIAPGGLPVLRVLELSIPLADALVAAHERGVVHRDLKPGNVMVTRDGRVKVLDFGLAKLVAAGGAEEPGRVGAMTKTSLTSSEQAVGTVPYMAPEQIRAEPVDGRTDLFALGVILYELSTGRRPFAGPTPADVASSILRDAPEPIRGVRADVPGELVELIERCLEKDPRRRVPTATDVCQYLRRLVRIQEREAPAALPSQGVATIAVLPFVNRSGNEEDEYFSDGLSDELMNLLGKIRGLRVAARTSSFRFKGKSRDPAIVGRKLKVETLLEGSVRKAGDRVRISVQLVKASDGYQLWSEAYDRRLEDIFAVQDDIAQSVVKELRTRLLGGEVESRESSDLGREVAAATRGRGKSAKAHGLYLRGRYLAGRINPADSQKGIGYLEEAVSLDPENALAWVELGDAYDRAIGFGWIPVAEGKDHARAALERALTLEPDLAEGYARLGAHQMAYEWDWHGSESSYRRGLELAPWNASVLSGAGALAYALGRLEEAIGLQGRAVEQDPLSLSRRHGLGVALYAAGRLDEAESTFRVAIELGPQGIAERAFLSLILSAQGRVGEALEEARSEPNEGYRLWSQVIVNCTAGLRQESDRALAELIHRASDYAAYQIAEAHAIRGDADSAFDWLERAYALRDPGLTEMLPTPHLRPLHGDPRWTSFKKKMGFDGP